MPTLKERVRYARALSGITQLMLARKIGVHRSAVAQWESPIGSTPSMEHLIAIAVHTCVNLEWLGTGRGSPLAVDEPIDIDHEDDRAIDALEVHCLRALRRMPRRLREQAVAVLAAAAR
jgi:transcriptional regulator with XRE-family HTH domain